VTPVVTRAAAAALGLVLAAAPAPPGGAAEAPPAVHQVRVEGTSFVVTLPDGRVLARDELVGAELDAADERGRPLTVRVDAVARDPRDPAGEVVLYRLGALGPDGAWRELCLPDPEGGRWAFPLEGAWTEAGEHLPGGPGVFTITCTSGAIGKCVRAGYKPWAEAADGTSLRDHHQACVRLFRADYCGDGRSWTRDGTLVDLYDGQGVQAEAGGRGLGFEAGWGRDGAVCVARPRVPENVTLDELERRCPAKLAGRIGPAACTEDEARRRGALILTKS
jgi:hypothetical protein